MRRFLIVVLFTPAFLMLPGNTKDSFFQRSCLAAQEAPAQGANPAAAGGSTERTAKVPTYAEVAAVMANYHCTVCHGGTEPRAGLSVDDHKSLMKGSKHGPIIIPGNPEKSELIRRLKGTSEPRMPYTGPPWLADAEVATIEQWIAGGAKE